METEAADQTDANAAGQSADDDDEITQILLRHERKTGDGSSAALPGDSESDKSDDSDMEDVGGPDAAAGGKGGAGAKTSMPSGHAAAADEKMSSSEDEDSGVPKVKVGAREYPVTDIDEEVIAKMTPDEVEKYTQ